MPRRKFDLTTDYLDLIGEVNKALPEGISLERITQTLSQRYNNTVTLHCAVFYPHSLFRPEQERVEVTQEAIVDSTPEVLAAGLTEGFTAQGFKPKPITKE